MNFNPFLEDTSTELTTASQGLVALDLSLHDVAVTVPLVTAALTGTRAAIQGVASELIRIEEDISIGDIQPLFEDIFASQFGALSIDTNTLFSPLTLAGLIDDIQQGRVAGTGAADITSAGIPELTASPVGEVDTLFGIPLSEFGPDVQERFADIGDRDQFLGAFNVSDLFDDITAEFEGIGGDLVAAFIQNPNQIGDAVGQAFTDFLAVAGGNIGDQIQGAIGDRFFGEGGALAGLANPAFLNLGALALGGGASP